MAIGWRCLRAGAALAAVVGASTALAQPQPPCEAPAPSTERSRPGDCRVVPGRQVEWRLNLGGVSAHSRETQVDGKRWNETHPGIGLERRTPGLPWGEARLDDPWLTSWVGGTFTDSRDYWSLYAGGVLTHHVRTWGRTRIDAGAGAFLFYRSNSWNGHRRWVPALLPVVTFTDTEGPLGFNVLWRPPGTGGPGTVFLQVTYRFSP